jgi:hypothetical protein
MKITGIRITPHGGLFENGGLFVKISCRGGGLFGRGDYWRVGAYSVIYGMFEGYVRIMI